MNRIHVKALAVAVAAHLGVLLFGGLLFFHGAKKQVVREDVELIDSEAAKEADKKEPEKEPEKKEEAPDENSPDEALAEDTPRAPELQAMPSLEGAPAGPALDALSLSDLAAALDPGTGDGGGFGGGFSLASGGRLGASGASAAAEETEMILSMADLDRKPRPLFQAPPSYPVELRKKGMAGTVFVGFLVDTEGRVQSPKVEKSTNPAFDRPAVEAVRQWKFEAGTRNGEKVRFKMRVPITFSAS